MHSPFDHLCKCGPVRVRPCTLRQVSNPAGNLTQNMGRPAACARRAAMQPCMPVSFGGHSLHAAFAYETPLDLIWLETGQLSPLL